VAHVLFNTETIGLMVAHDGVTSDLPGSLLTGGYPDGTESKHDYAVQ
jgi:hypothetical protein